MPKTLDMGAVESLLEEGGWGWEEESAGNASTKVAGSE